MPNWTLTNMDQEKTMRGLLILSEKYGKTGECYNCKQKTFYYFCSRLCAIMFMEAMEKQDAWYNSKTLYEQLSTPPNSTRGNMYI